MGDMSMTGRRVLIACVVAIGAISVPQQAEAWPRWLGFLEELSGPGPFTGIRLDLLVLCMPEPSEQAPRVAWGSSRECGAATDVPEIVVEYSRYASDKNDLFPEEPESDFAKVKITSLEGSLLYPLGSGEVVFVGGGVGIQRFSGDAFGSFYRPALLGNLRIYPLGQLDNPRLKRFIAFSWVPTLIFPGYDWQDFGAPQGTFSESVDMLTGRLHVTLNFGALLSRR
jgi:hypothetical protein